LLASLTKQTDSSDVPRPAEQPALVVEKKSTKKAELSEAEMREMLAVDKPNLE